MEVTRVVKIARDNSPIGRRSITNRQKRLSDKITLIPFYGGGKGQSLQIIEKSDGSVITSIIKTPPKGDEDESTSIDNIINTSELENPPLPSKFDLEDFGENLKNIQNFAQKIISLQEILKQKGKLSPAQETAYKENMDSLSSSALRLAEIQEKSNPIGLENREGISAWLENKKNSSNKNKNKKKEEDKKKDEEKKRKADEEKRREAQKRKEEQLEAEKEKEKEGEKQEGNQGEKEEGEKEEETDSDSIGIGLPADEASVAEARPVGLAVAGEGGVAASKPIATAVVGPGGLAIARPVGTAIAGVDPAQALIPIHAENYVLGSKPKAGHTETANEYLSKLITKFHQN